MRSMNKENTGFTLMELMIVVALVSILAAIAYPSYLAQVHKGNRAAMQGDLQEISSSLEQWRAQHFVYPVDDAEFATAGGPLTNPDFYDLTYTPDADNQGYSITATPTAGLTQETDGVLKIDSIGQTCFVEGAADCDLTDPTQSWSKK